MTAPGGSAGGWRSSASLGSASELRGREPLPPAPAVTVEYTYQVVADGDILYDFTKMDDAVRCAVGLNSDCRVR